jgi:hypothetical protein
MSLATLTTANLESLIALVKKRDSLKTEIAKVEDQIQSFVGSASSVKAAPAPAKAAPKKARGKAKKVKAAPAVKDAPKASAPAAKPAAAAKPAKKGKRGALKESILATLQAAGPKGVSVKDLSAKLGVKNQNLHVWFSTTGKTVKGLKKTATGTWAYAG